MPRRKSVPENFLKVQKFLSNSICDIKSEIIQHPDLNVANFGNVLIMEETFNMFIINKSDWLEPKLIPKTKTAEYKFNIEKQEVTFTGNYLIGLSKDRKKRKYRKWT
jgi:RNase P/RNase MRP subunit p29